MSLTLTLRMSSQYRHFKIYFTTLYIYSFLYRTFVYFQIIFEGVIGYDSKGDIAIDDIDMDVGLCSLGNLSDEIKNRNISTTEICCYISVLKNSLYHTLYALFNVFLCIFFDFLLFIKDNKIQSENVSSIQDILYTLLTNY